MKNFFNNLKANDYVITISSSKAARNFSACIMVANLVFYFWLTPQWVSGKSQFGPSPQFVPNLLTVAMFLCALVVFITESFNCKKKNKQLAEKAQTATAAKKTELENADTGEDDFFEQLIEEQKSDTVAIDLRGLFYIFAALASAAFYVFCAEYLGFILTIIIIMVGLQLLYGVRKPVTIIVSTLAMSVGMYYAFTQLLALVLPAGKLF